MIVTGKDIKQARKNNGMTQAMLAEKANYSIRQIERIESDDGLIKLNKHIELLSVVGLIKYQGKE